MTQPPPLPRKQPTATTMRVAPHTPTVLTALLLGCAAVDAFLAPLRPISTPTQRHLAPLPSSFPLVGGRGAAFGLQRGQRLSAGVDTEEKVDENKQAIIDQKAQQEFERLLQDGTDLLGLVDHLKKHRGGVKLTWEQVSWSVGWRID